MAAAVSATVEMISAARCTAAASTAAARIWAGETSTATTGDITIITTALDRAAWERCTGQAPATIRSSLPRPWFAIIACTVTARSFLPGRWSAITDGIIPRPITGAATVTGRTARGAAFATIEVDDERSLRAARAASHGVQNQKEVETRIRLFLLGVLAVQIGAAALSAPAAAKRSGGEPSTGAVVAACHRTKGCWVDSCGKNCAVGCSPHACFSCTGTCVQLRQGRRVPIRGGNLIRLLNGGAKSIGGTTRSRHGMRPVSVSGVRTKTISRTPGPTDQGGKGLTGYRSTGPAFPMAAHNGGRNH